MAQYQVDADELWIGNNVVIEDGVKICGKSRRQARAVVIGDNTFVGRDTHGAVDDLWIGEHTILNSTDGLSLGNGVGVDAYSQLWTHIYHATPNCHSCVSSFTASSSSH
jgi:acyl-[acyl carrier protein]--UDP-N-acetylglucosamine O-acyltransferase